MLHKAICEAIDQTLEVISCSSRAYNEKPSIGLSPIGKHIRHIIDHLSAFQEGTVSGCVDYNQRHRGCELESQPDLATETLTAYKQWISSISCDSTKIDVISEISVSHQESVRIESSHQRELVYLVNHTLHHVAYASLLAKSMGIQIGDHLGIAPATSTHLRETREPLAREEPSARKEPLAREPIACAQ